MMTLETNPPRHDRRDAHLSHAPTRDLVMVASEPRRGPGDADPGQGSLRGAGRAPSPVSYPNGLRCTRIAADAVSGSAAWHRRLSRRDGVSPRFAEPIGPEPGGVPDLPDNRSGILDLLDRANEPPDDREVIAGTIAAIRSADAVIAGPLAPDDANATGLLPHLAELAGRAYRALRPPRELIVHPAFGQVARRFHYIQMSDREARGLGEGAMDLGILAHRLRRLQGDPGEFAITSFGRHGLLWADNAWWDIDPIGGGDESVASSVFCLAWVVARRFRRAGAAQALAYARAVAAASANPAR